MKEIKGSAQIFLVTTLLSLVGLGETTAANLTWTGNNTVNWSSANNWSPNAVPGSGDFLTFNGTWRNTNINDLTSNTTFSGIYFSNFVNQQGFAISGNAITLGGDITTSAVTVAISGNMSIGVNLGMNMTLNGDRSIDTGSGYFITITGAIKENGTPQSLTKLGLGSLILTGNNTYTGNTTVLGGSLALGNGGATGTLSTNSSLIVYGRLSINRNNNVLQGVDFTGAPISGNTGVFNQDGSGTTQLTANNTYGGQTRINNGKLVVSTIADKGVASNLGTAEKAPASATISLGLGNNNGTLEYIGTGSTNNRTFLIGSSVQGNGSAVILNNGSGALVFTASTFNSQLANITFTANRSISLGGNFTGSPNEIQGTIQDTTTSGNLITTGLIKMDAGTWILSGNNSYSGATTINSGTLQIGNNGTRGTVASSSIINNATLTLARSNDFTLSGLISGTGALIKNSDGTAILTANNTYTGATTINAGTLQIGNNGTSGSIVSVSIINNSTLGINRSNNLTLASNISGSGKLLKNGAGTLTLSGNNSYLGGTTVNAGTLAVTGYLANQAGNTITINNGGTFSFNRADVLGDQSATILTPIIIMEGGLLQNSGTVFNTLGNITLSGGTLQSTAVNATTGQAFALKGLVTINGSQTSTIAGNGIALGAGSVTDTTFNISNGASDIDLLVSGVLVNGAGTSNLTKSGAGKMVLSGANTFNGTTSISSGTLATLGTDRLATSSALTIDTAGTFEMGGNQTLQSVSGNGVINLGNYNLSTGTSSSTFAGSISGTGSLTKAGAGTFTLNGTNTFSGNTLVSGGTLVIANANALLSDANVQMTNNSTLTINQDTTIGTLYHDSGTLNSVGNRTLYSSVIVTQSGALNAAIGDSAGGPANLSKISTSITTIGSANTFTGTISIANGTLQLDTGGSFSSNSSLALTGGTMDLNNKSQSFASLTGTSGTVDLGSGQLTIHNTSANTYAGTITGSGSLTKNGSGTLTLGGNNSYSGGTTINSGTLATSGNERLSDTSAVVVNSGATFSMGGNETLGSIAGAGQFNIGSYSLTAGGDNSSTSVSGIVSGSGSLTKTGTGTLTLSGNNNYSGITTINDGTLQIGSGSSSGSIASTSILNNAALAINRSDELTLTSLISGTGSLTQSGIGTTILTANNTYTGTTTINAGTLQIGNGGATGFITSSSIINEATLVINRSNEVNISSIIGGNGSLIQDGEGTVRISANNTYTGTTTINAGTLSVGGVIAGATTVNAGATLAGTGSLNTVTINNGATISPGNSPGTITVGNLTWNAGGNYNWQISDTTSTPGSGWDFIHSTGSLNLLSLNATNKFNINLWSLSSTGPDIDGQSANFNPASNYSWDIASFSSIAGFNTSYFNIVTSAANGTGGFLGATGNFSLTANSTTLTLNYNGSGAATGRVWPTNTGNWTTPTQWAANTVPTENNLIEYTGSGGTSSNDLITSVKGFLFSTANGSYVVNGTGNFTTVSIGSEGITNNSSYSQEIALNLDMSSGQTFSSTTANITVSGNITTAGNALVTDGNQTITISGIVSGNGSVVKNGTGILLLSGNNTYTGGTRVVDGTLIGTTSSLQGEIENDSTVIFDQSISGTYSGIMSGSGSLTKNGTGTVTLSGNNSYSGSTIINNGTLQIGNGGVSGSISSPTIVNNSTLSINRSNDWELLGDISGSGQLIKDGVGTLTLSGANSYSGGTTINSGTLAGTTASLQGNILNNANINFNQITNGEYSSVLSGSGQLIKNGAGTLTLSANNTYTGTTTISAGTIQIGNGGTSGNIASTSIVNNSALVLNRSDDVSLSSSINGTGSLTKNGNGTATLSGINSYTGGTTINSGTLAGTTSSLQGNIENYASILFDQSTNGTYASIMSGSGSLIKNGTATLTLTGANTYTGGTTIHSGTLAGTTSSLQGDISNNAAILFDQSTNGTYSSIMSGTGYLIKDGTATLTLTGANTYTGGTTIHSGTLAGTTSSLQGNISNNAAVLFDQNASGSYVSTLSGNGTLIKLGVGSLTLSANNTYTGATIISAGTLQIGDGGTSGNIASTSIVNNSALVLNRSNDFSLVSSINGTGSLTKNGNGTATLSGNNSYTGGTVINSGTLAGTTASLQGNIENYASILFAQSFNGTYSDTLSGTGSLIKDGTATLTLAGNMTYTGATTVNAGTLAGTTLTLQGNISNNASVLFNQSSNGTYSSIISGTGSLIKDGTATLTLSSANTYTGGTTVNSGTLAATTATISGNIANNASVVFDQSIDGTYAGSMSGNGVFLKNGVGILVLSGSNTFTGTTAVNSGTLSVGGSIAGTTSINTGATLSGTGTLNAVTINNGATINPGNSPGTISVGNMTWNAGGNYNWQISNATSTAGTGWDFIHSTGSLNLLSLNATNKFNINLWSLMGTGPDANGLAANFNPKNNYSWDIAEFGTSIAGFNSDYFNIVKNASNGTGGFLGATGNFSLTANGTKLAINYTAPSINPSYIWDTAYGDWSTNWQWVGQVSPPNDEFIEYTGPGGVSVNDIVSSVNGLLFSSPAGAFTVTGTGNYTNVTIGADGITNNSTRNQNVAWNLTLNGNQTFNAAVGNITISGNLNTASYSLTIDGNKTTTFSGNISSNGSIYKNGLGTAIFSGNNTDFTGAVYINNGTILLGHVNGLNTPESSGIINFDGGQLTYAPGVVVDLSPRFRYANNSTTHIDTNGTNQTYSSVIDADSLTKDGSGTISLTAPNTYPGKTTINAGTLQISGTGSLGADTGNNYSGQITNNGTFLYSSSVTQTLSGNMTGSGNLIKNGTGVLNTTASIQVINTIVEQGLLAVNGNLISNNVYVNPTGILGGNGTITSANIAISGTLSPGNSPGTIVFIGNPVLSNSATTNIEIASLTNFDRILVSGQIFLAGKLNAIPYNGFTFAYGQRFDIIEAASIVGTFSSIIVPTNLRARFLNSGTIGTLLFAPDSYTDAAETHNQKEVAAALDKYISAASGDKLVVSTALDNLTLAQYPAAFDEIAPGYYESLANIVIEQSFNQSQMLNQRMSSLRFGTAGFQSMGGVTQPLLHDKDGKSAASPKNVTPIDERSMQTNWNLWTLGTGSFSRWMNLSQLQNYNSDAGGFLIGSDYRWGGNLVTGLYAGYDYTYSKYNDGSTNQGNSVLFGGYASFSNNGYYADAIAGEGYTGFQTHRSITFGTIDRTASADPGSAQFTTSLNLGKDFQAGHFTFGPMAGAQFTTLGIGGFTETGANSLNLAVDHENASSLRTTLGARLAYTWEASKFCTLIPEIRMSWQHEFLNNPRTINATLDGGNGPSFGYQTAAPYRNSVFAGTGVSAILGKNWSGSLFYNVNFGSQTFLSNMVSAGLNFAF